MVLPYGHCTVFFIYQSSSKYFQYLSTSNSMSDSRAADVPYILDWRRCSVLAQLYSLVQFPLWLSQRAKIGLFIPFIAAESLSLFRFIYSPSCTSVRNSSRRRVLRTYLSKNNIKFQLKQVFEKASAMYLALRLYVFMHYVIITDWYIF